MDLSDKISVSIQMMILNNSTLQSYRALFIAVETILFAFVFALTKSSAPNLFIKLIGVVAIFICLVWVKVSYFKGKETDHWRKYLFEKLIDDKDFQSVATELYKGKVISTTRFARIGFNYVLPFLIIGIWLILVIFPRIFHLNWI